MGSTEENIMNDTIQVFYDELAENYHLIFENWDNSVKRHSKIFDGLIQKQKSFSGEKISLLDCSCGIGTQAIGLALMGYDVCATDISPKEIERAKREALRMNAHLSFGVADFRNLKEQVEGTFDVAITCDNSLPHLLTEEDIKLAFDNIWSKLKDNGLFLASIRNYDKIISDKPHATTPYVYDNEDGRRIIFQVWDWEDERLYKLSQFIEREHLNKWETVNNTAYYRAITRDEITRLLEEAGFSDVIWLMPEETGYHQPIVIANKK